MQLTAALDVALLVRAGVACARSYLQLAHAVSSRSSAAAGLGIAALPCSSAAVTPRRRFRRVCARWCGGAIEALQAVACAGELCRAANASMVCVTECFSIFNRPHSVNVQEQRVIGVHDHVLSDHAVSAMQLQSCSSCHFPLVSPSRQLRSTCVLPVKIW